MAKLEPLAFWELWVLVHVALGAAPPVILFLYRARWRFPLFECFLLLSGCCLLFSIAPHSWTYVAEHPENASWLVTDVLHASICTGPAMVLVSSGACWLTHVEHPILSRRGG